MIRFLLSIVPGIAIGVALGLVIGWGIVPVEYVDSSMADLQQSYKDDYLLMIAKGFLDDGDVSGVVSRVGVLGVENVPEYVQNVTERYITNSADVEDIRYLVALSEGIGRLTPIMEPYRQLSQAGQ